LFSLGRQRAFIKVQDGCRYRCAFCIVTLARGEEKSRTIAEVVDEINAINKEGVEEFVLTGVHLGGWGSDLQMRLEDLLQAVLKQTTIPRLRLGSLEPWELSEGFFAVLQNERLMPHLHLPLQSGSDAVLRRMARRCKTTEFAEITRLCRNVRPDINISTDIIVGFPGETDAQWEEGLAFIETQVFVHIHIFSYSPRAGTKAAELPDQIPSHVKKDRAQQLQRLASNHKRATLSRFLGREMPVLWEAGGKIQADGKQRFRGLTPNYLRVETLADKGRDLCRIIGNTKLIAISEDGDYLLGKVTS
jgi:threonylcarbamoyladenosine tRNA methylthiotransferase MtaB